MAFLEFSKKLKEMGHDVYVIAAGRNNERSFDVIDGVQITRIPV